MVVVPVRGLNKVKARGHTYYYHRATGTRIKAALGTPEFLAEVHAAESLAAAKSAIPGTLGGLIAAYRESNFWSGLRPATQLSYDRAIAALKSAENMPLIVLNAAFVAGVRDKLAASSGRWLANYSVTVLGILCDFARERDWIKGQNPTRGVRRIPAPRNVARQNRPWTPAECRAVLDAAPKYLATAIGLAMLAGMRKRDVLTASRSIVKDNVIEVRTSKRGRAIRVPLHPALKQILASAPAHEATTLCVNSYGEPWTESGFNSTFIKFIAKLREAEKVGDGLTFHGLRHTSGTRWKEAGADDRTIADLLGQSSLEMANLYSELADTSKRDRKIINAADVFGNKKRRASAKRPAKHA